MQRARFSGSIERGAALAADIVIPAQAGIRPSLGKCHCGGPGQIPAFAGMTDE